MTVSYDSYRVFYAVAKNGGFTRAAVELNNSQPNITRIIGNLEQTLGCTLFVRSKHGATLTPEGEKLYAHIAVAVSHIQAGEAELAAAKSLEDGIVSIAVSETALHGSLLSVLKRLREKHPKLRLRVANCSSARGIEMLNGKTADFALITTPFDLLDNMEAATVKKFREFAVAGTAFRELAGKTLTFSDLTRYPLVCLGEKTATYRFYADLFLKHGASLSIAVEAATSDQILPLVESNLGIGFVPQAFLKNVENVVPLKIDIPEREIKLVKRKDVPLSLAAKTLSAALVDSKRDDV